MDKESAKAFFEKAAGSKTDAMMVKPGVEGIAILLDIEDVSRVAKAFADQHWNANHSFTFADFKILYQLLVDDEEDEFETVDDMDNSAGAEMEKKDNSSVANCAGAEMEKKDDSSVAQNLSVTDNPEEVEMEKMRIVQ